MNKIADLAARKVVEMLKSEQLLAEDRTLSAKEAAEVLRCSVKTVYNLVSLGEIPYRKSGRRLVFSLQSLMQYLHR
jgi:excisionase family DNA binding protein